MEALFRDLLIGVTNFFRDPEVFSALEAQVIPRLFAGRSAGSTVRIWTPGCSTGEESYSIAMLLQEHLETLKHGFKVQVFATDIDRQAIATARAGRYPASIAIDVSAERLARFFTPESDTADGVPVSYHINKSIRDLMVFSEQDLIKDPPFSRIDLISCRNLLIYLNGDVQKKLMPLFHYALNPGGFLFLGTSETIGEFSILFASLDRTAKLYQRKEDFCGGQRLAVDRFLPPPTMLNKALRRGASTASFPVRPPLRELTERALLLQLAPTAALINGQGDILYLHGRTGMYLEPAPGEAGINNILKMAREGLRRELTAALHGVELTKTTVHRPGLRVKTNGHFTLVNLTVSPMTEDPAVPPSNPPSVPLYLVIMEEALSADAPKNEPEAAGSGHSPDIDERVMALQQELQAKDEYLQSSNEELETSNEELKSANEEMQSVNEELQSTNEELETSKEELQSVNEELSTVNAELQTKVADLSRANNDMNNLLAGTGIGTVFVDRSLHILRFSPAATRIINLIQSDVGRPVRHIASNLVGYDRLVTDLQSVLDSLVSKEVDIRTTEGRWFTMRIMPYRTLDNVIEGAVMTFFDITEMNRTREALRKANELLRLAVVVHDAYDAITMQDLEGRILAWNPAAVRMYGWSETEALAMNIRDRIPEKLRRESLATLHRLSQAENHESYRTQRLTRDGKVVEVWITSTALVNEAGQMYAIATTERLRKPESDPEEETHNVRHE